MATVAHAEYQHEDVVPVLIPERGSSVIGSESTSASQAEGLMLEVDTSDSDGDLVMGEAPQSTTSSVSSSIYDYVEEHGRTYHRYKQGKYVLPNDAAEQDRLDLQHHLLLLMLKGNLQLAPVPSTVNSVLDIGTGTGIWAIEFANNHPSASVIGSDLSPIQPAYVPPNCRFEVDDAEDEWTYTTPFDFIHMRGMMTCFRSPRTIIQKAYDNLEPGGYLEMQDAVFPLQCHDSTLEGTALDRWGKLCVEGGEKLGRPWTNTPHYKRWMEEIGFDEVVEKNFETPTNTWPRGREKKEWGIWFQADALEAVESSVGILTRVLGWDMEKVEELLADVKKDIKNRGIHAFMPIHIVYGRKPFGPTFLVENVDAEEDAIAAGVYP